MARVWASKFAEMSLPASSRVAVWPAQPLEFFALERGAVNERVHEVDLVFTVRGLVVDARDQPVSGAEVRAYDLYNDPRGQRVVAHTDDHGRFSLPVYGTDTLWAYASASGRAPSRVARVKPRDRGSEVGLRLAIGDRGGAIVGDVLDPAGRPLAGAAAQ